MRDRVTYVLVVFAMLLLALVVGVATADGIVAVILADSANGGWIPHIRFG